LATTSSCLTIHRQAAPERAIPLGAHDVIQLDVGRPTVPPQPSTFGWSLMTYATIRISP